MGEQTKNMLVGFFILAACALTVSLVLFLKPSVGDEKKTYYVRFSNINQLNIGTQVLFAGKPVGQVVAIQEIYDARKEPSDRLGRVYFYQLEIKVDSKVNIYTTDQIAIQTSGLLGEKSIAIIPKKPAKGVTPQLITTQPIYADSIDPIESAFIDLSDVAGEVKETFSYVNHWLHQHGDLIADAIGSFKCSMDEITTAVHTINSTQLIEEAKTGMHNFSQTMDKMNSALSEMQKGEVFTHVSTIMKNFSCASASIVTITDDLAGGKGTLGKLIKNDDMYLRFTSLLSKADTLMNDVNHYGILFHLNKSWQRQRLQKVTLLDSLNTPASFKDYFEKEVGDVNMAMSRLSMLIEKAQNSTEKDRILSDRRFTKDFAELLREVDELSDNLKLYNQQLIEAQGSLPSNACGEK